MHMKLADVNGEYSKDSNLRKEDVEALQEWISKQPHLPKITELQLILFLHSCYYSLEATKTTIDTYFAIKSWCPEIFANRDLNKEHMKTAVKLGIFTMLPKFTPEGYRIFYCKMVDSDASKFVFLDEMKLFHMGIVLSLMQHGTSAGFQIVIDLNGIVFGHLARLNLIGMKKFMYYLQEALPVRLKGIHFINVVSFMDKILALMKPFMKKELMEMLYLHTESVDDVFKFVPQECLPSDYGGSIGTIAELHESFKKSLYENIDYFIEEERQLADESKRIGKPSLASDVFGVDGSFKKLDID